MISSSWWPFDPVVLLAGSSASHSPFLHFHATLYPLQVFLSRRRKFPLPLQQIHSEWSRTILWMFPTIDQVFMLFLSSSSSPPHSGWKSAVFLVGWNEVFFSPAEPELVDQQDFWLSHEETRSCWPAGVFWACQNAVHQSEPFLLAVRVWHFTCEQMFYRKKRELCLQTRDALWTVQVRHQIRWSGLDSLLLQFLSSDLEGVCYNKNPQMVWQQSERKKSVIIVSATLCYCGNIITFLQRQELSIHPSMLLKNKIWRFHSGLYGILM